MDETPHPHEAVSALADGQLHGEDFARTVEFVASDAHARARWHAYHLVGDVLRSAELAVCRTDTHFIARLRERLQHEQPPARPAIQEPAGLHARRPGAGRSASSADLPRVAANDANVRWKLVAGLAVMVAVLAVVWHATNLQTTRPESPQLAQATPAKPQGGTVPAAVQAPANAVAVARGPANAVEAMRAPANAVAVARIDTGAGAAPAMIRDPQLDALLVAHEQLGRSTVLQMHAGFLRNAAFGDEPR